MADRAVTAQIKLLFSAQSMGAMQQAMRSMVQGLNNVEDAIERSNQAFSTLGDTGASMIEIAQSFLNPLQSASDAYVQRFGMMEKTSARWIQSTLKLEQAQMKLGRAATQALQPMQDQMVSLMGTIANFVSAHPELLRFAVGTAGTILAAGTAMAGIAKAVLMINQLRASMMALNATGGVAGIAGKGALGLTSAALGVGLGIEGAQAIGRATGDEKLANADTGDVIYIIKQSVLVVYDMLNKLDAWARAMMEYVGSKLKNILGSQVATAAAQAAPVAQVLDDLLPGDPFGAVAKQLVEFGASVQTSKSKLDENLRDWGEQAERNTAMMAGILFPELVNGGAGSADESDKPLGVQAGLTQDILDQFEQYQFDLQQQQDQFNKQEEQQKADHLRQMALLQEDYDLQEKQAKQDFVRDQQQANDELNRQLEISERDYLTDQQLNTEQFQRDELLRQKDFNLDRQRAEEDHRRSILDAAGRLDALAVIQEQRQYATDSKRAQQDFAKETQLNKENYKIQRKIAEDAFRRQQQDARDNFAVQRRLAEDNFRLQQQRAQEAYRLQRERAQAEYEYQRNMQRVQFENERQMREAAYKLQMQILLRPFTVLPAESEKYYNAMSTQFLKWFNGLQSAMSGGSNTGSPTVAPPPPSSNTTLGGYTPPGYALGGYTPGGVITSHVGEFMLSPSTTRAMEQRVGMPLTQSNVLRGGAARGGITVQMSNVFENVGAHSAAALESIVSRATARALTGILKEYVATS